MESKMTGVVFEESQTLAAWVKGLMLGMGAIEAMVVVAVFRDAERMGTGGLLVAGLTVALTGLLLLGIAGLRMQTVVEGEVIRVRMFPLLNTQIRIADVVEAKARKYSPIGEYGGWGIRRGWSSGWAYNMRGDEGVQLVLRDGKRILIGSQRAGELAERIMRSMSGSSV